MILANTLLEKKKFSIAILGLSIAILILHHTCFFYGYFGYDDLHYAKLSYNLLQGNIDYTDHYSYRWPILLCTSLSYYLFGVSDFSSALPSLIISCTVLVLMYWMFRNSPMILIITILLFFIVKWNVFYTDKLMPDIYVSFFVFLGWIAYISFNKRKHFIKSLLFAFFLFLAFLSKGTIILMVPLLIYYLFRDIKNGNFGKWKYAIPIGIILMVLFFGLIYAITGHPLSRFNAIDANSYLNPCSYDQMPISETLDRITFGFVQLIWDESLIVLLIIPLLAKIYATFYVKHDDAIRKINFYFITIIVLFFSMNFMTISLKSYNPGCLDIRHYLFAIPIMAVSTAYMIKYIGLSKNYKWLLIVTLIICSVPTIKHMKYAKSLKYSDTKTDVVNLVETIRGNDKIIISNQVMINLIDFYSEYEVSHLLYTPKDFDVNECNNNCYIISNWYTEFHSNSNMKQLQNQLGGVEFSEINKDLNIFNTNGFSVLKIEK